MMGLGGLGGPLDMLRKTGSRDERRDAKRLIAVWNRIVTDGRAADERFKLEATTRKASALEADEKKEERRDDAPSRRRGNGAADATTTPTRSFPLFSRPTPPRPRRPRRCTSPPRATRACSCACRSTAAASSRRR